MCQAALKTARLPRSSAVCELCAASLVEHLLEGDRVPLHLSDLHQHLRQLVIDTDAEGRGKTRHAILNVDGSHARGDSGRGDPEAGLLRQGGGLARLPLSLRFESE